MMMKLKETDKIFIRKTTFNNGKEIYKCTVIEFFGYMGDPSHPPQKDGAIEDKRYFEISEYLYFTY